MPTQTRNPLFSLSNVGNASIWAEVDMRKSWLGAMISILFKLPSTYIELELRDGTRLRKRFPASMAKTGFLLSPYGNDINTFVNACDTKHRDTTPVNSFNFSVAKNLEMFFQDTITISTRSLLVEDL
jgi:hypothetical protein